MNHRLQTYVFLFFAFIFGITGAEAEYKILKKVPVPGDSGWNTLTLDATNRRLYITHGTRVNVFNVDNHTTSGSIANTPGVQAVAVANAFNRGFITQSKTDSVVVFDLKSLKKIGEMPTQKNPDSILYDPATQKVFAFNTQSNSVTSIDPQTMDTVAHLPLPGRPEFAVADGNGSLFVNLRDQNSIAQLNSRAFKLEKTFPLIGCREPTTLAIDTARQRLFAGCANKQMVVLDVNNGKTIATFLVGDRVDSTIYDAESALIFNSNNDGTVTVIKQDSADAYRAQETIQTQIGARTAAYDSKTRTLFLVVADFGPIPPPTEDNPRPKQKIVPGTFNVLVVGQ